MIFKGLGHGECPGKARGTESGHFRENSVRAFSGNIGFLHKCPELPCKTRVASDLQANWDLKFHPEVPNIFSEKSEIQICWLPGVEVGHSNFLASGRGSGRTGRGSGPSLAKKFAVILGFGHHRGRVGRARAWPRSLP